MALDPHAVTSILRTRPRSQRKPRRRGIVILVVISVLVLFMLMLVAFAVVSGHYRDAARAFAYRKEVTVKVADSRQIIDDVLSMVLSEPGSPSSNLWGHSLLSDLYGESINGFVTGGATGEGGANPYTFVSFAANRDSQQTFPYVLFSNTEQFYVGCVLTFKDGPCAGQSTRVTHYLPSNVDNPIIIDPVHNPASAAAAGVPPLLINASHLVGASGAVAFRVEAFENGAIPQPGNRFVVNGKPFSGTGMGRPYPMNAIGMLDVSTGYNWHANNGTTRFPAFPPPAVPLAEYEWALMPNLSRWSLYDQASLQPLGITAKMLALRSLYGGANEPWDTFDYQNMWLALSPTDSSVVPLSVQPHSPSYHRPELMDYWVNRIDTAAGAPGSYLLYTPANLALLRQICMRPLAADHPLFTGSNPNGAFNSSGAVLAAAMANRLYRDSSTGQLTDQPSNGMTPNFPIYNPWDVDNDNDGVPDSIWIDPGLPICTAPDGRQYKPLVAIMIRDQDGKVNVSAAGSSEFASKPLAIPQTNVSGPLGGNDFGTALALPRGLGVGAAEINPISAFIEDYDNSGSIDPGDVVTGFTRYQELLQGTAAGAGVEAIPGKYGLDYIPPAQPTNPNPNPFAGNRRPGILGPNSPLAPPPGVPVGFSNDQLSVIKTQGFGLDYNPANYSNYATPSDVWGRGAIALDYAGQPLPFNTLQPTPFPFPFNSTQRTDWLGDGSNLTADATDSPYELNLVDHVSSYDTPYTVAELETVLRRSDPDAANLAPRLFRFLTANSFNPVTVGRRMNTLTTLGMHIPFSPSALPSYMKDSPAAQSSYNLRVEYDPSTMTTAYLPGGRGILDVCQARIKSDIYNISPMAPHAPQVPSPNDMSMPTPLTESNKQKILKQIMPFELFHGEPFNINRPFGNGVDDNGNGVVDEPGETDNTNVATLEPAWTAGPFVPTVPWPGPAGSTALPAAAPWVSVASHPLNDALAGNGIVNNWWCPPDPSVASPPSPPFPMGMQYNDNAYLNFINADPHLYARQLYARNLYCLLLLFCDPAYVLPPTPGSPEEATLLGNPVLLRKLFCRRMAQYAINAVDFRDPDAIMTPFEYDELPFDGWHVDGNLLTDENTWLPNAERGLVWGMEHQDLVLKETISFHNRRVRDTTNDDNPGGGKDRMGGDNDLDQIALPQGSTFMELFCARPRVVNNPKLPVELYNAANGLLDLGRPAPNSPPNNPGALGIAAGDGAVHPVWQIAISAYMDPGTDRRPITLSQQYPDTFSLEPTLNPSLVAPTIQANVIDASQTFQVQRYVWFMTTPPDPATGQNKNTFYAENVTGVQPGQYLVIAPRQTTYLGSQSNPPNYFSGFSQQRIDANPAGGLTIRRNDGSVSSKGAGQIQTPAILIASADPPPVGTMLVDGSSVTGGAGWNGAGNPRIGLSVTEPLPQSGMYYTRPDPAIGNDLYDDPGSPMNKFPDQPFDYHGNMPLDTPGVNGDLYASKTHIRTHTIVLQRLANPLQGFHPILNPYINLDWAENDTTVFAGDENTDRQVMVTIPSPMMQDIDTPHDPAGTMGAPRPRPSFSTRQRGNTNAMAAPNGMLWYPVTADPQQSAPVTAMPAVYFSFDLNHTLGYVNGNYTYDPMTMTTTNTGGMARPLTNPPDPNAPAPGDPTVPAAYVGDPSVPFPWITWNNRPFANPMELMQVPTSSPQRIDLEFNHLDPVANVYNQAVAGAVLGHFSHLPNFFLSTVYPYGAGGKQPGADLYRIFDHVETPSPFVGTERWYRPDVTAPTVPPPNWGYGFRAPHNHLSRGRVPGKINVNTIVDPLVWDAVTSTFPAMQTTSAPPAGSPATFYQLLQTRRGYINGGDGNTTADMFASNLLYPTMFANPVRPADTFDLQPLPILTPRRPVDSTLLRGNQAPLPATAPSPPPEPVFAGTPLLDNNLYKTLAPTGVPANHYTSTDRNSYFRHQRFTKLSNMFSTTSNTFAVWVTVGYFEVIPNTPSAVSAGGVDVAHPDGYQLGQEMTFDGVVRRPRAFFLLDRSIPVGFEPGQTHNIEKCVLQRRYLD